MAYEVELKFPLLDRAAVLRRLDALGAVRSGTREELDMYFDHPARSFAQTDEALRVRRTDAKTFFTYKGPKVDASTKTRIEIELELAAGSAASDAVRFWESLGFRGAGTVRKSRDCFEIEWQGRCVGVTLDRVDRLGDFMELELSAEPAQLDESRQILKSLADRLGLQGSERRSYLELLLNLDASSADTPEKEEDWSE